MCHAVHHVLQSPLQEMHRCQQYCWYRSDVFQGPPTVGHCDSFIYKRAKDKGQLEQLNL